MSNRLARFSVLQRILHWLMAVMVLTMLFIGVTMVATVGPAYLTLVDIHKPLGIAILALVLIRLALRWRRGAPRLPQELPPMQAAAAHLSHWLLYSLLLLMPLIGWGMLSAGGYPIVLWGPVHHYRKCDGWVIADSCGGGLRRQSVVARLAILVRPFYNGLWLPSEISRSIEGTALICVASA